MENQINVLIVDDEQEIINSLGRLLRQENYQLLSAATVDQGCIIFDENSIDLVIADYQLASGSGLDLFRYVQNHCNAPACILLTGHPDLAMSMSALNNDLKFKIVLKPWDNERLKNTIAKVLKNRL